MAETNYVLNGMGYGPVGQAMNVINKFTGRFDPGLLRPFIESDPASPDVGRACAEVTVGMTYNNQTGQYAPKRKKYRIDYLQAQGVNSPVFNSTTLTRADWIAIDAAVVKATRLPLTAWSDLRSANTKGGFDAWTKLTFEYNTSTDVGEVVKSMDATEPARDDTPLHSIRSVPLPIIHGDFSYPQRLLDMSRANGMPLDTDMVEMVTRRGWEMVEKTLIGTETGITWGTRSTGPWPHTGTSTEYGYATFPYRVTKTDLTTPTGTNPEAIVQDVMEMVETMLGNGYRGPFILYYSTPYSIYLNSDYYRTGGTATVQTVRERIAMVEGIADIRRLDYLTSGYQMFLLDLNTGMFQAINGMEPRTIQWDERGGLIKKFCVMMIQTAVLKAPPNGIAPLVHGTVS